MIRSVFVLLAALAVLPAFARAQLLSPGELSAAHGELQGVRQCTRCHQLGQRGTTAERCLACHDALAARLRAARGYHATVTGRSCGSCHAEHYGRGFALVRLDTATFDHAAAGYALRSAHARVTCRGCHRAEHVQEPAVRREMRTAAAAARTFLGLSANCASCHAADDPHGRQFAGRECRTCHEETRWTEAAAFDHGSAAFTLAGRHARVECAGCHAARQGVVQYRGMAHGQCTACHADAHRGGQGGNCASCHTADGWNVFGSRFDGSRFDHDRTRFPLRAAHARAACLSCHRTPARADARIRITLTAAPAATRFPAVVVRDCRSCHVPAHPGAKPGRGAGGNCADCHGEAAWSPAAFGSREHAATRFPLDGAHVLLACTRCHTAPAPGRLAFHTADVSCSGCHGAKNPHGGAYADRQGNTDCARCHGTRSWAPGATAHEAFALTGGHAQVACASCHTPERARVPTDCEGCHAAADPHRGRSAGRGCGDCHDTSGFAGASRFDHGTTRYPLEGAHGRVACRACHARESAAPGAIVLRYRPVPLRCEECHGR